MKIENQSLYEKVSSYQLDDPDSFLPLSERVRRENGWSTGFTERVVKEYLRFAFLCTISPVSLTPSDEVDQMWHMHILYVKEYELFCKNFLGKTLYHGPTRGGDKEGQKFYDWYEHTKNFYQEVFDERPPEDIWPQSEERFRAMQVVRVDLFTHMIIKVPRWLKKIILIFRKEKH